MDLELLRRFEVESVAARAHQVTRERQLRDICALGTSTTIDGIANVALAPVLHVPPHLDGNKGYSVCFAAAAVNVWDDNGNSDAIHPAHLYDTKGSTVCLATAALKTWDRDRAMTMSAGDEWPVLRRLAG